MKKSLKKDKEELKSYIPKEFSLIETNNFILLDKEKKFHIKEISLTGEKLIKNEELNYNLTLYNNKFYIRNDTIGAIEVDLNFVSNIINNGIGRDRLYLYFLCIGSYR